MPPKSRNGCSISSSPEQDHPQAKPQVPRTYWSIALKPSDQTPQSPMSLIRINRDPSRRQLAIFAFAWAASLAVLGWLLPAEIGGVPLRSLLWVFAVVLPSFGLAVPGFMRGVYLASAYAALPIGLVMSYLILAVIYYLVITPTGLMLRLFGHDPLSRRFDRQRESYWTARKEPEKVDRYFQQF